jgi:tripartite-type tricarboxylate transporter receptor subunit TctC
MKSGSVPRTGAAVLLTAFALAVTLQLGSASVHAQGADAAKTFPAKPIRISVPFAPGGSNDIFGRYIGQKLPSGAKLPGRPA